MNIFIGPVKLSISFDEPISFLLLTSKNFTTPVIPTEVSYNCHYSILEGDDELLHFTHSFSGQSENIVLMPYDWHIYQLNNHIAIKIDHLSDKQLSQSIIIINQKENYINIKFKPRIGIKIIETDPLSHPVGSLLMVYLAHFSKGFLIHSSGITDLNKGRIFTAVSGTGKSTMANIWQSHGAKIINDDRLWIHKLKNKWFMLSTPMTWYAQKPLAAPIDSAFLIRQYPFNKIKKLSGTTASMRIMSNCIQHFYNKEMTEKHLDYVIDFTSKTPVYDCAFKPDGEIIGLIRSLY